MDSYLKSDERAIITLLSKGKTQYEIAEILNISRSSIEKKVQFLKQQYEAKTMFGLAVNLPLYLTQAQDYSFTYSSEEVFIAETDKFIYFQLSGSRLVMYKRKDLMRFALNSMVEKKLCEDIVNGKVKRIAPDFIDTYQEIQLSHG